VAGRARRKTQPGLAALLAPVSVEQFLAHHWPEKPLLVHEGAKARLAHFACATLKDVSSLCKAWRFPISVNLPDKDDEYSSITVEPGQAERLYRNGMTISIGNVDAIIPKLAPWKHAMFDDLDFQPELTALVGARYIVYASPHGRGTSAHFDQNSNFVIQLAGKKRWRMAPNRHVRYPTARHTMNTGDVSPELGEYLEEDFPRAMPPDAEEIELRPGSLLFVPRGYWHETLAEGESLSLNFTFGSPTFADLLLLHIGRRLRKLPHWRVAANGLRSAHPRQRESVRAALVDNLARLLEDLGSLDVDALLREGQFALRYSLAPGTRFNERRTQVEIGDQQRIDLESDREIQPLVDWVAATRTEFNEGDLLAAFPEDRAAARRFLEVVTTSGILTRSEHTVKGSAGVV
jgi:50S ribosomal protein L16 3-hydroxylase